MINAVMITILAMILLQFILVEAFKYHTKRNFDLMTVLLLTIIETSGQNGNRLNNLKKFRRLRA